MNKIFQMTLSVVISITTAIFSLFAPSESNSSKYISPYEYIDEVGPKVIKYIKEQDKEGLNSLFCDKVKDTEYLCKLIDSFFEYINENGGIRIEDNGEWDIPQEHDSTSRKGERVVKYISGEYRNRVYIDNVEYALRVDAYTVIKKYPEFQNVNAIRLAKINKIDLTEDELNIVMDNKKEDGLYLCMGINYLDYEELRWKNLLLENMEGIEKYHYTFNMENGSWEW